MPKPRKKNASLTKRLKRTLKDFEDLFVEYRKAGGHAAKEIIIPEYIGFQEVSPESVGKEEEAFRVYERGQIRFWSVGHHLWKAETPDQEVQFRAEDMQQLILVLNAIGSDVTLEGYANYR